MNTPNAQIQPTINGYPNPRLDRQQFLKLEYSEQQAIVYRLMTSMCYPDPELGHHPDAFQPGPTHQYAEITPETVVSLYDQLQAEVSQWRSSQKAAGWKYQRHQGQEIKRQQDLLGFTGTLEMTAPKLQGYFQQTGQWNAFEPALVNQAIATLEANAPRIDYGPNNPNTSRRKHTWKTTGDYLIMHFNYIDANYLARVQEFFSSQWQPNGVKIKADSIRIETEQVETYGEYYNVDLVMWWD